MWGWGSSAGPCIWFLLRLACNSSQYVCVLFIYSVWASMGVGVCSFCMCVCVHTCIIVLCIYTYVCVLIVGICCSKFSSTGAKLLLHNVKELTMSQWLSNLSPVAVDCCKLTLTRYTLPSVSCTYLRTNFGTSYIHAQL